MLYEELVAQIQFEAKLESDSNWTTPIQKAIYDAFWQLSRTVEDPDNFVSQHSLTSANQDATTKLVKLPSDFARPSRVEFSTATNTWELPSSTAIVPPPLQSGKPKCYEFYGNRVAEGVADSNDYRRELRLFPAPYTMVSGDALLVSYFRCPVSAITLLTTGFKIRPEAWIPLITAMVVNRIEIYKAQQAGERINLRTASLQMGVQGATQTTEKLENDAAS